MSNGSIPPPPPDSIRAIQALIKLGNDGVRSFGQAVERTGPILCSVRDRSALVAEEMAGTVAPSLIETILTEAIIPIRQIRTQSGIPVSEFFDKLTMSLDADKESWNAADRESWLSLKPTIVELLASTVLTIEDKARELVAARPKWLQQIRIFSDLRPVFDDDTETIRAMVLVNTLSIAFNRHGKIEATFFDLDPIDLDRLSEQIERARWKNALLIQQDAANNLPTLNVSHIRDESKDT